MCARNFCRLFGVISYSILDLSAVFLIFIFFADSKLSLLNEMFHFAFGISVFDLVLLGLLRFSIMNGLLFGVICNHVHGTHRLRKWNYLTTYFGCLQAIYVVLKILIYSENHSCHVPERFWSIIGITLFSCVMFHVCWKTLSNYKKESFTKLSINAEDGENNTESKSTDETVDPGKMNTEDLKEAEKLSTSQILKDLFKFAKPDLLLVSVAFLLLIVASISQAIVPYYTGLVVNYIVIDKSIEKFHKALIYMALITILAGLAAGLRAGMFTYFGGRYSLRLQKVLLSKFMMMEIGFFDARKTGELTSRLTSDCTKIGDGLSYRINIFTRSVVKVIGILFFMIKLSWKLSTVSLVVVPIVAIVSKYFGKKYEEVSEKVQNALAQANSSAEEALSSVRTVRSFAAEKNEIDRYSKFLKDTQNCFRQEGVIATGYRWSTEGTSFIMSLLILYYGGHLVMQNELAGGNLLSFILYSFDLTYSIQDIGDVFTGLMEIVGASKKVFLYINRKTKVPTDGKVKPHRGIDGHVEFKDVSFAYPTREDITVLNDVSFTAAKGEVVALVGPSGGGKSSVINLLQHFYEPKGGQILIDGVPVKDYDHDFLHEKMSLVQQEPILFARTISENIKYGLKSEIADFDVKYSAELANAHSFISSLPNEYDTPTGEKGIQLSGGQKQRIAIARALIRNPAILLLDEATSALDSESEHLVQQAINKNLVGRTVIVIAHRLSTVEKADKIIVIENGSIVEVGKHQELMDRQGAYAALVKKQLLGLSEEASHTSDEPPISKANKRTKSFSSSVRSNTSILSTSSSNM